MLLVVSAAVLVVVMNGAMVNVAIPIIVADFVVSEARVEWAITAYLLVFAVGPEVGCRMASPMAKDDSW